MTDKPQRRKVIDPAVSALMGYQEERKAEAKAPKAERVKKAKERKKAEERLPGRVNLDLPPWLKKQIFALAEAERIPASQVAAFFLADGLRRLKDGDLKIDPYLRPSGSPRYSWNIEIDSLEK